MLNLSFICSLFVVHFATALFRLLTNKLFHELIVQSTRKFDKFFLLNLCFPFPLLRLFTNIDHSILGNFTTENHKYHLRRRTNSSASSRGFERSNRWSYFKAAFISRFNLQRLPRYHRNTSLHWRGSCPQIAVVESAIRRRDRFRKLFRASFVLEIDRKFKRNGMKRWMRTTHSIFNDVSSATGWSATVRCPNSNNFLTDSTLEKFACPSIESYWARGCLRKRASGRDSFGK